jgi:hypothetical protein
LAYTSPDYDLVPGDTNDSYDVFVRDLVMGTISRASVDSNGLQGDGHSGMYTLSISADGRFVAFDSRATNLVPGDSNGFDDLFVHDMLSGSTTRVNVSTSGTPGDHDSSNQSLSISADGRCVAFSNSSTNLVGVDTNGASDVFVRDAGEASAFVPLCFGDGSGAACPCSNAGSSGHGCENSASTGGALLSGSGSASLATDAVQLTTTGELSSALSVYLQGTIAVAPTVFGDGLRCAGGTLKRLYSKHAVGGVSSAPQSGDPSISARSAALGDTIPLGATRVYQVYYRDANLVFCGGGFNITNAMAIAWGS